MEELRKKLKLINHELFELIKKRRELSKLIQSMKPKEGAYPHWDILQEKRVFESLESELEQMSPREIAAFSLLLEDHACAEQMGLYPEWSKAEHLGGEFDILQQVNPLLLNEASRGKLPYTENFQQLMSMVESSHEKI